VGLEGLLSNWFDFLPPPLSLKRLKLALEGDNRVRHCLDDFYLQSGLEGRQRGNVQQSLRQGCIPFAANAGQRRPDQGEVPKRDELLHATHCQLTMLTRIQFIDDRQEFLLTRKRVQAYAPGLGRFVHKLPVG
jgi:hypothetical protein